MAAPPDIDLSPYAVGVMALGTFVGPHAAQYVSAYAVILVGWFCGLMIGLWRRDAGARMPVWAYTLFTLLVSVGGTVTIAEALVSYTSMPVSALLFPVAAAIPALPDKWGTFGQWAVDTWKAARGVKQ